MTTLQDRGPLKEDPRVVEDQSQRQARAIGYGLLAVLGLVLVAWAAFDLTKPTVNNPTSVERNAPGTTATERTSDRPTNIASERWRKTGVGGRLVEAFTQQLGGQLKRESGANGTTVRLTLPSGENSPKSYLQRVCCRLSPDYTVVTNKSRHATKIKPT